ncbi:MAG TPA: ABC transporter permease [Herpetosiphonaceae bacterium]|nr:ABC transporter permease [Herpetosiphonaceae bacterium]
MAAEATVVPTTTVATEVKAPTALLGVWRRFRRNKLALFGLLFVVTITAVAVLAPVLTRYTYDGIKPADALQAPSRAHIMGTDTLGRDMLTRILYGARPMLIVGVTTQVVGVLLGVILGALGGYAGGFVDWFITRLIDLFSALPWYLIVLYMVMVLSPSLRNLIIALSITSWVGSCRLVRGLTFSIREQDYILAARALGFPPSRILLRHVIPQAVPLLVWSFAAGIPVAVFAEAGLSLLGMGVRPPQPSWGNMLGEAGQYWQYFPHMFVFPSAMITLSVLAFQGLANGLREALSVTTRG